MTTSFEDFMDSCGPSSLEEALFLVDALDGVVDRASPFSVVSGLPSQGAGTKMVRRAGQSLILVLKGEHVISYFRKVLAEAFFREGEYCGEARERHRLSNKQRDKV